jgi:adenylate cyclase
MERRLAAILVTDMVGYSRLMGLDEEGTIARQRTHKNEVFDPRVAQHGGRIFKTTGDGMLVEFPSVVDAVKCAMAIQTELNGCDADVSEDRRIRYRIGINLGDIVSDGDDILGDGVNVATRLEGLAEPGGVCISGTVYDHLAGKVDGAFEDAGEQTFKNVPRPVRCWHWRSSQPAVGATNSNCTLPLPDKPSIAVLPFNNISGDSDQEYFADGITDDIITDLSKISGLFVIARNSTFVYKGRAADIKQVARELGVRYVLEGSVRKGGAKVRINAQLIDAATASHLWAERYDGELQDIFSLQDQITESIVATLAVTLPRTEQDRAMRKEVGSLRAYDYVLRGNAYHHLMTKDDNVRAKENFEHAIKIDPEYAPAYAGLAWVLVHDFNQWGANSEVLDQALDYAKRAVRLDDSLAKAHMVLGDVYLWTKQNDQAVGEGLKAISLEPSNADAHFALGVFLRYAGRPKEALEKHQKALRFNPMYGHRLYYLTLGHTYFMLKQYEAALTAAHQAASQGGDHFSIHRSLAMAYAQLGCEDEARRHAEQALRINPNFSIQAWAQRLPYKYKSDLDHFIGGMRKAGLPE